jgi:hypothetical protein
MTCPRCGDQGVLWPEQQQRPTNEARASRPCDCEAGDLVRDIARENWNGYLRRHSAGGCPSLRARANNRCGGSHRSLPMARAALRGVAASHSDIYQLTCNSSLIACNKISIGPITQHWATSQEQLQRQLPTRTLR